MCKCAADKTTKTPQFEKKFTLAQYFNSHWDDYVLAPNHFIKPEQYKAVNAIRLCRTDALGKDIYACKDCGNTIEIRHNCKNRFCPTCSWRDTLKWGDRIFNSLMAIPHRHVVVTLPHSLNNLVMKNQKDLTSALLEISSNLMKDIILKKFHLHAGVIAVLHTFGEKKNLHLHVHMIVSWGGVCASTGKLKALENPYINYNQLKDSFKNKYLNRIKRFYKKNELVHRFENQIAFEKFITDLDKQKWILHLEPPMKTAIQVVNYIGRYSKRACISEYKITDIQDEFISFKHKDYRELDVNGKAVEKILTLHYSQFFPLLLQHVPLPYFRLVRYYGAYNSNSIVHKKQLFVNQKPEIISNIETEINQKSESIILEIFNDSNQCKNCKGEMIYIQTEVTREFKILEIYKKLELLRKNEILKNVA